MGDLRGELMKAFGASEAAEAEEPVETPAAPEPEADVAPVEEPAAAEPSDKPEQAPESKQTEAERARDESGRFAKDGKKPLPAPSPAKGKAPKAPAAPVKPAAPTPQPSAVQPQAPATAAESPSLKPPSSWKPQAREKWGALPPEVQAEVARVDGEVRKVLATAAETRRQVQGWQQAVSPFEAMIRAEGHEPQKAVESLLRQAHLMRFGSPAAKAEFVEGLIERNQVPVDAGFIAKLVQRNRIPIEALAEALDGKAPAPGQGQPQPAPMLDPAAIARQVREEVQRDLQRAEAARFQAQARDEAERFLTGKEFSDDVRELMADLMEVRARSGKVLSLEDAYNEALKLHPDIAPVLQQRTEAEAAKAKQAASAKARAAASSVKSQPTGAAPAPKPTGLRAQLEENWAAAEQG
ncbi:MAG TPA: hypothetical protein VFP50_15365 [Anaeromyxobacteraceae bacterium]|nr:hypothetical protein [Anaeromyxobacteraceae bacterium]